MLSWEGRRTFLVGLKSEKTTQRVVRRSHPMTGTCTVPDTILALSCLLKSEIGHELVTGLLIAIERTGRNDSAIDS
jgi:hypothetical protein